MFQINVLAPYVLTALIAPPRRLIYVSSGLHRRGVADLNDVNWQRRPWDGTQAYADSKLFDVVLASAVARLWPDVLSAAMEPGWVRTKLAGSGAPGDVSRGADTQVWLATSTEPAAIVTGGYLSHRGLRPAHEAASDPGVQDGLLATCDDLSGVRFPTYAART